MYVLTCLSSFCVVVLQCFFFFFFFNDTATTEIYTLSLHDALPICESTAAARAPPRASPSRPRTRRAGLERAAGWGVRAVAATRPVGPAGARGGAQPARQSRATA